jgi:hypothetical protein
VASRWKRLWTPNCRIYRASDDATCWDGRRQQHEASSQRATLVGTAHCRSAGVPVVLATPDGAAVHDLYRACTMRACVDVQEASAQATRTECTPNIWSVQHGLLRNRAASEPDRNISCTV